MQEDKRFVCRMRFEHGDEIVVVSSQDEKLAREHIGHWPSKPEIVSMKEVKSPAEVQQAIDDLKAENPDQPHASDLHPELPNAIIHKPRSTD